MNFPKKTLSKLLIMAILFSSVQMSMACSNKDENKDGNSSSDTTSKNVVDETTAIELKDNLPEKNMEGKTFTFLEYDRTNQIFIESELYAKEQNGDIINDAVYKRNRNIEERFNMNIASIPVSPSTYVDTIRKSVLANDKLYDMVVAPIVYMRSILSNNLLIDMKTIPYLDFTQPWWDQRAYEDLSISNKLYHMVSSMNMTTNQATWVVIFNKELAKQNDLESPYDLVRQNKWNLDTFHSQMKGIYSDLNGNSEHDPDDQWAFATENYNTGVMVLGSGEKIFAKDKDDIPVLAMNTERNISAFNKTMDIMLDKDTSIIADRYTSAYKNPWEDMLIPNFVAGRTLFFMCGMLNIPYFRDMEQDFGVVPIPKYDENQSEYYHTVTIHGANTMGIPKTNTDLENTGIIMEALAYESYKEITPAYYESSIKNKLLRDNDSVEMLDIIFSSRSYDPGLVYNWGGMLDLYITLTQKESRDFTSSYAKNEAAAIKDRDKLIASME